MTTEQIIQSLQAKAKAGQRQITISGRNPLLQYNTLRSLGYSRAATTMEGVVMAFTGDYQTQEPIVEQREQQS